MPLRTTIIATTLVATPLAIATGDATGAPASTSAIAQCQQVRLHHAGNNWFIAVPAVWESSSTRCNLKFGDLPHRDPRNPFGDPAAAIKALQRNLNYCYGAGLTVDGRYGSLTRAAVQRVQRRHGIAVDGIYGPQTRSAMNWREYNSRLQVWSQRCYSPI